MLRNPPRVCVTIFLQLPCRFTCKCLQRFLYHLRHFIHFAFALRCLIDFRGRPLLAFWSVDVPCLTVPIPLLALPRAKNGPTKVLKLRREFRTVFPTHTHPPRAGTVVTFLADNRLQEHHQRIHYTSLCGLLLSRWVSVKI